MKNVSSSVVDQFTKAMAELSKSNKQPTPTTVPGTIVSIGGSEYQVLLDGSTVFTPAKSTVAYASGDRVNVTLADHQATIVGNYTDQSVGSTAAYNAGYSGGGAAGTAAATIYLLGDGQLVIGTAATNAAGDYIINGEGATIITNSASSAGATAGQSAGATAGASAGQAAGASAGATAGAEAGATAGASAGQSAGATAGQNAANTYISQGGQGYTIIVNTATNAGATAGQSAGATAGSSAAASYLISADGQAVITGYANTASQAYINAQLANIENVVAGNITADTAFIQSITSQVVNASDVYADMVKSAQIITDFLTADSADIETIISNHISAEEIEAKQAWVESLEAAFATIVDLKASFADIGFANVDVATINQAKIEDLFARYASFEAVEAKVATVQKLIADSGYITTVESAEGVFTKRLEAVEIDAGWIVAGVIKAERLQLLGEDGLYHHINMSALEPEAADDTDIDGVYINGIDGSILVAKTITADKISVTDLHAFNATIGGLEVDSDSIHSIEKTSVSSSMNGFYVDNVGQFSVGDGSNYIRYYMRPIPTTIPVVLGEMSYISGQSYLSQAGKTWFSGVVGNGADTTATSSSSYHSSSEYTPVVIKYDLSTSLPVDATLSRAYISINCRSVTIGEMAPLDPDVYMPEDIHFNVKNSSGTILGTAWSTMSRDGWEFIPDDPYGRYETYDHIETIELPTITSSDLDGLYLECIIPDFGGTLNGATLFVEYLAPDPTRSSWGLDVNFSNFEEFENERATQAHYIRFNELSTLANATNRVAVSIGSDMVDDKYILEVDNVSGIKYVHAGDPEPVSFWDRDTFHSGNLEVEVTKKAQFGNFAFTPRTDGSLMLLKVK